MNSITAPRSAFAFVPRSVLAEPQVFGKNLRVLAPAAGFTAVSPNYRAAVLQHVLSFQIRDAIRSSGRTLPQILEEIPGMTGSKERHERILRGETMMQLSDIMMWASRFPTIRREVAEFFAPNTNDPIRNTPT